ncbi:MAG: 50S ribosomal protein L3 [Parachlamydiales bacterium]|jgi:large subunit ribosomal protein L3
MALKLKGKKRGMTQLFDDKGTLMPCTVIELEPNVIAQIKTKENDGYIALQLGFDKITTKDPRTLSRRLNKPQLGHYAKNSIAPRRNLHETRVEKTEDYSVGQELGVDLFADIAFVDVTAVSKGKGYQGVMKLHGYAGGPASHGSGFHRHAGSTGMRSTPGRCLKGGKRASHMGSEQVTVQNIQVVKVDKENNLIIVKGQVPGPRNGLISIAPAIKKRTERKKKAA